MNFNELCERILTAQEEMLKHKIEANSVTLNGRKYGKLLDGLPPNVKPTIFGMALKADYALPDDYDFLVQYDPPQIITNADRIRSMTDEELAEFLRPLTECVRCCAWDKEDCYDMRPCYTGEKPCKEMWKEWLKQPAE